MKEIKSCSWGPVEPILSTALEGPPQWGPGRSKSCEPLNETEPEEKGVRAARKDQRILFFKFFFFFSTLFIPPPSRDYRPNCVLLRTLFISSPLRSTLPRGMQVEFLTTSPPPLSPYSLYPSFYFGTELLSIDRLWSLSAEATRRFARTLCSPSQPQQWPDF